MTLTEQKYFQAVREDESGEKKKKNGVNKQNKYPPINHATEYGN